MNEKGKKSRIVPVAVLVAVIVAAVLILGTLSMGRSAKQATDEAVRSVSMFYLDELVGRREQVVHTNLQNSISDMKNAISIMTDEDLKDAEHLSAFQARMKTLYGLDKFAFVDEDGLIYTALGLRHNIDVYDFDYKTLSKPEISIKGLESKDWFSLRSKNCFGQ